MRPEAVTDLDLSIDCTLFVIKLIVVIGVHFQIVEGELLLDSFLERLAFLESKRVGFSDDGNHVDHVRELL